VHNTQAEDSSWDQTGTILIADGDKLAREFLRDLLRSAGYRVHTAGSGSQVLRSIRRHRADLLLLDVRLPEPHGLALLSQLRNLPDAQRLPVILITEPGAKTDLARGFESGADDFLVKPVDQVELMARVKGHLRTKGYRDEVEREKEDLAQILDISKAVSSNLPSRDIFRTIVERTSRLVDAPRCSLVVIRQEDHTGVVLASSQGPKYRNFVLDLAKYPEIQEAVQAHRLVLVKDVETDPLVAPVREKIRNVGFRSLMVLPISLQDNVVGTLVLSTARPGSPFTERNVRTCQLVAEIAANALQNAHVFENLDLDRINIRRYTLQDRQLGIYHDHVLRQRLEEEVARSFRYRQPVALFAIEASGPIPDADTVFRDLVNLLKANVRRTDVLARHNASQRILLMLPVTSPEGAQIKAERLRAAARTTSFAEAPAGSIPITLGGAVGIPQLQTGGDRLLSAALEALAKASAQGPDTIVLDPWS
jgi:two-component system cell cycle response regulator